MQSVTPSEDNDSSGMTVPQSVGQALPATGNLEVTRRLTNVKTALFYLLCAHKNIT